MARGMFNFQDNYDWDREQEVDGDTLGTRFDPRSVDYGTIPSDLIRDEIAETAFIRDFVTKFKDKLEGKDPSEYSEWIRVLGDYATGNAELSDLEAVDVSGLMDVEGFEDYYYGVVPRPLTEDTEEKDPRLLEAIQTYGQEAVDDALAKIQELEDILGKAIDDPFGTLEGIITSTASGTRECSSIGPKDWVLDCVTVGVTLPFPLPLPGPLGGIFKGATVRDVVETVQSAGHEIGKVLSGETSVEEVLDDLGEWIGEKVQGVLGDDEKGTITIESVLGAIGGFLPNVAASVIWSTFQNKIENKIGLPILLTTEDGTEDSRCRDAEGNLTPWGKRNPASCGQPVTFEESDLFGTGGLDSTVECTEGTLDTKGNCVCPDGTLEDVDGKCADTVVDTVVSPTKQCQDPDVAPDATGNCPEDYCADGTTLRSTQPFGMCPEDTTKQVGEYTAPTVDCNNPKIGFNNTTFDATASAKYAQYSSDYDAACGGGGDNTTTTTYTPDCNEARPSGPVTFELITKQRQWDAACGSSLNLSGGGSLNLNGDDGEDKCTGGKVQVNGECVCPSGTTEINGQCVSVDDGGGGTTPTGCSNGATEESGCDTCPDGTSVLQYEDGICPSVSPPLDCSDPAYAAANPEECGTGGGGSGGSGGGGGGGSSIGSGMFDMTPSEITASPELLAASQFPIVNFLSDVLPKNVKTNVMKGLFEGLA